MTPVPPDRFRTIIDNLNEVVFQTDGLGRLTFLNRAWEEITGFTVQESLGASVLEFIHPDDREINRNRFRPVLDRTRECFQHEVRYTTKDGGVRWLEVHARLTLDESGGMAGISGTLSDVTERRRASEELRLARHRIEVLLASNPAVLFAGRPGKQAGSWETTFISDSIRSVLGFDPEQFIEDPTFWMSLTHPDDSAELLRATTELASKGHSTVRCRNRCRDGSYRWTRIDARRVADADGHAVEAFGCVIDETPTRKIEESLRSHAGVLDAVGYAAHRFLDAGSWRSEIDGIIQRLGIAACASRVYVFENSSGPNGDLLTSMRYEWASKGANPQLGSPHLDHVSYRELGFNRWVEVLGRGDPIHGNIRHFPISEQNMLAEQGILSLVVAPVFTGRDWWGFIGFDDCEAEREWSTAKIDALRAAAGILGAAIRRDETESALRRNEALLRTMTDASPFGFYVVDNRSDQVLYFNDRFCGIWGIEDLAEPLRRGELANKGLVDRFAEMTRDVPAFAATCAPLQDEHNRSVVADYIPFRDGRTIRRFSTQIRDTADQYFGRLFLFEDVTEQKRTEGALLRSRSELELRVLERTADLETLNERLRGEVSERRAAQQALADREAHFRALIENASDVVFVSNADGVIQYASPAVTRILGYDTRDLIGKSGFSFLDPQDAPRVAASLREGLAIQGSHAPLEFRIRHRNGSNRIVEAVGNNQLNNPAVRGIVITLRDITEGKRLEEQFRQAQKMEAVGRLAGGVAHDFNNLLTVICGYSELMTKRLPEGDPIRRNAQQIKGAGDRATSLVQQLLTFSRKQIVQPVVLDVNEAIAELDKMLRRLIGEDVELTFLPAPEPACIHIDRTQFDQIILNLSVNARDAMPNGGALSIRAVVHHDGDPCPDRGCNTGERPYVAIELSDTGTGIPEDAQSHIFEPFFTTKDVGKGTGLGLSMVYGAVRQAGGHICFNSEPGSGTTFRVCLPRVEKSTAGSRETDALDVRGGKETILLVEDEELVRTLLSDSLKDAGYNVVEAGDGAEALEFLLTSGSAVDLLVTDVVMPRMNGRELAARMAQVRPSAGVLYVSGYPRQELTPGCRFLKKPFTPEKLVCEVRAALDSQPVAAAVRPR